MSLKTAGGREREREKALHKLCLGEPVPGRELKVTSEDKFKIGPGVLESRCVRVRSNICRCYFYIPYQVVTEHGLCSRSGSGGHCVVTVSAAMVASAYKYVTWHTGIKRFIVQIAIRGRSVYKSFATEKEALNYLVKLTGKPAQLREEEKPRRKPAQQKRKPAPQKRKPAPQKRKPAQRQPTLAKRPGSAYRYVSWHKGLQRFIVQFTQNKSCAAEEEAYKSFATEEDALKYVVTKTKKKAHLLLRTQPGPDVTKRKVKHQWSSYQNINWHSRLKRWVVQHGGEDIGLIRF